MQPAAVPAVVERHDPEARRHFWTLISSLAVDHGTTILLTTHYLDEAEALANRVAVIAEGTLAIEMGAVAADLKLTIHAHPTLSETVMESAEAFFGHATHVYRPKRKS